MLGAAVTDAGIHVCVWGLKTNPEAAATLGIICRFGKLVGIGMAGSPELQTAVPGATGVLGATKGGAASACGTIGGCDKAADATAV